MATACPPLSLPSTSLLRGRAGPRRRQLSAVRCSAVGEAVAEEASVGTAVEPLLVSAIRGKKVERPPVWLMRQAGSETGLEFVGLLLEVTIEGFRQCLVSYQLLCERYPKFRERSENVDLVVEISLQPWKVFKPDGVILFSDILTPLPGMNIPFDIVKGKGPVIYDPLRTAAAVNEVREFVPEEWVPYVGQALNLLRQEVKNEAAVLGFVGAPFTLASYCVEGGSSKNFTMIKKMAFSEPTILHNLLQKFTTSMANYIRYQADNGAQAVQIFDSWATELSPADFEEFSLPYLKQIVDSVRETHPSLPLILYASGSGGLLERLPLTGVDVVSLDWTVDMAEGRKRLGSNVAVQGNVDPGVLFGSKEFISKRIYDTVQKAGNVGHVLNLGHGIKVGTPEENVAHFFEVAKGIRY
ncbi:Uroporphyrinogen decarboxylase 2, chloroplastic [Dichanthelium oligosanthes]|uniref:uroporphyrinogen decarboxylase n=1 Tax=Dichanthelium oligosanthes TaxID=888268 RepID=A0A1E5VJ83_9POAL|nr:Uroporphyrinogen decarboxylase 2, chloroplastic [Dichanthelium oligosanthes]